MGKLNVVSTNSDFITFPVKTHNGFYCLEAYFTLAYYTCLIPFRIKYSSKRQHYEVVRSPVQKILCIIRFFFYVSYILFCHGYRLLNRRTLGTSSASRFLLILESLIDLNYALIVTYTVFCKFSNVDTLVDKIQEKSLITPMSIWKRNAGILILVIFLGYSTLINIQELAELQDSIADATIQLPFIGTSTQEFGESNPQQEKLLSPFGKLAQLIMHFMFAYDRTTVGDLVSFAFVSFGVYLCELLEALRLSIATGRNSLSEVLEEYLHIKRINDCMNSMIDLLMFHYVIETVPFLTKFLVNMGERDAYSVLGGVHIGALFLASMASSASANAKLDTLKQELILQKSRSRFDFHNYDVPENASFTTLLFEFSSNSSIGLKGWTFFTATYQFLGMVLSQCVAFSLMLLLIQTNHEVV